MSKAYSAQRVPAGFGRGQSRTPVAQMSDNDESSGGGSASNSGSLRSSSKQQSVQSKGHRSKHRSRSRSSSSESSSGDKRDKKVKMRTDEGRDKERDIERRKERRLKKIQGDDFDDRKMSTGNPSSASSINGAPLAPSPSASKAGKEGVDGNVVLVHQLRPFAESVRKDVTEYIVHIDKSVQQIAEECDENGDLNISLASGISIERTVPAIDQRVQSLAALHSASDIHAAPHKFRSNNSIVYDAKIVTSHNSFPCSLKFTLPNLVGSSKSIAYTGNDANEKQALTFTLQKNEKLSNHVIMTNDNFEKNNFNFFSAFPLFNESNLRDGLEPIPPTRDGLERVLVPHTQEKMHPVVTLAQMDIARTLSDEDRKKYKNTIPAHLMSASPQFPDHYIMAKSVFETYHQRCADGLRSGNPLSDIANPHGKISLGNKSLFSKKAASGSNKTRLDSASSIHSSAKAAWTSNPELVVGRTTQAKKDDAKNIVYSAYARIQVRSVQTANLADLDTD